MDPLEFCLANHINGDASLTLRFCVYCQKAMCEPCHDSHKETCEQRSHSQRRRDEMPNTIMPPRKRAKITGASETGDTVRISLNQCKDGTQTCKYPECPMHHMPEEFFCCSHCKIICDQCHEESHVTCDVKSVTETCKDLNHTSVGEYRKWLNKLRIDSIQLKSMLSKNVAGLDNQKANALKDLENESLKVTDRLNSELIAARSEIVDKHDKYYGETCAKLSHLNALSTRLETSLKDSKIFEDRNLDAGLFSKFQKILYENIELPSELQNLYNEITRTKITFKLNKRFQPLMQNSKLGCISVTTTNHNIEPLPKLKFPFELPKTYDQSNLQERSKGQTMQCETTSGTYTSKASTRETSTEDSTAEATTLFNEPAVIGSQSNGPERRNKRQGSRLPDNNKEIQSLLFNQEENFSGVNAIDQNQSAVGNSEQTCLMTMNSVTAADQSTKRGASIVTIQEPSNSRDQPGQLINIENAIDLSNSMARNEQFDYGNGDKEQSSKNKMQTNFKINSAGQNVPAAQHTRQNFFGDYLGQVGFEMSYTTCSSENSGLTHVPSIAEPSAKALFMTNDNKAISSAKLFKGKGQNQKIPIQNSVVPATLCPDPVLSSGLNDRSILLNNGGSNISTPYVQFDDNLLHFNTDIDDQRKTNFQATTILPRTIPTHNPFEGNTLASGSSLQITDHCFTGKRQTFQNVNVTKRSEYNIKVDSDYKIPWVTRISVTTDGRIIMIDHHNERIKMITADRMRVLHLDLNKKCYGVTVYNDNTAVGTGHFKLFFIYISGTCLTLKETLKVKFDPYGIQTCDDNLLVTCYDSPKSVKLITEAGQVLWTVSEDQLGRMLFSYHGHITCYRDQEQCRVVVTDWGEHSITVLDGDTGGVIKVCEMKGKGPLGVTTDNSGNIYMCYWKTDEIVVWNKDMTNSRVLTNTRHKPYALGFDASRNQLIIAYGYHNELRQKLDILHL